jgi:hypothetical protein
MSNGWCYRLWRNHGELYDKALLGWFNCLPLWDGWHNGFYSWSNGLPFWFTMLSDWFYRWCNRRLDMFNYWLLDSGMFRYWLDHWLLNFR